jgi:hypothetical protein
MTNRPQVRIYTGNGEFIDREMNDEEFAQWEKDKAESDARKAALAEVEAAKANAQAKLAALGLTAEEIAALSK